MNMKRQSYIFRIAMVTGAACWLMFSGIGRAGVTAPEAMRKLAPFMGKWKTVSLYPQQGLKVPGQLEYRWVLGRNWVLVIFKGRHPERTYWEAIAMIRYDPEKKCYISHDYFNERDPLLMTGYWITPETLRFEMKGDHGSSGIDYTVKPDGSIYQENWIHPGGSRRKITLKTDYTRLNVKP
jgi:hypothetical protein